MRKLLIIGILLLSSLNHFNGHYQTTTIGFENIEGTCYATLLSDKAVSGTWSTKQELDLAVSDDVLTFFREYEDEDHYFFLNYLQDVSEGKMYWPIYPPERFKVLLYRPDNGEFAISDKIDRYALNSTFSAVIKNGKIVLERNYDYPRMIMITLIRIVILTAVSFLVTWIYSQRDKHILRLFLVSELVFQVLLNLGISAYSFRYGFSIMEYMAVFWVLYLICFLMQGYLYSKRTTMTAMPYLCSFFSNITAYGVGLILLDLFPALYTIE